MYGMQAYSSGATQASVIIEGMVNGAIEKANNLRDVVLNGGTAIDARRFVEDLSRLIREWCPELYSFGSAERRAANRALDLVAAGINAGLSPEEKIANYTFLRDSDLLFCSWEKAEGYEGIIAGLNGSQYSGVK